MDTQARCARSPVAWILATLMIGFGCVSPDDLEPVGGTDTMTEEDQGDDDAPPVAPLDCDPLLQDCMDGHSGCYPSAGGFICEPDLGGAGGHPGDECQFGNECGRGLYCGAGPLVPGCVKSLGCCTRFCDLTVPDPGCPSQTGCATFFDDEPPPGYEHVGGCIAL